MEKHLRVGPGEVERTTECFICPPTLTRWQVSTTAISHDALGRKLTTSVLYFTCVSAVMTAKLNNTGLFFIKKNEQF